MKVEVTLQFEVPEDCELDFIPKLLKERIVDFNYKDELVKYNFITSDEQSIAYKTDRLEHLEQAVSAFKELISDVKTQEAHNLLCNHSSYNRIKGTNNV